MVAALVGASACASAPSAERLGTRALGGWGLTTPAAVASGAALGLDLDFLYGPAPSQSSALGEALTSSHMRVISAEISDLVSKYECSRTFTVARKPRAERSADYCAVDSHYNSIQLAEEVHAVVQRNRANPLIAGYWVLDDVADWDGGGLKDVLAELGREIPADRPTICGFSADLEPSGAYTWDARRAENFTSDGCDFVAPYVYADSRRSTDPPFAGIDWTMSKLLPRIVADLEARGRNEVDVPMLGVGQSFGGRKASNGAITQPPRASDMVAQATAYCRAGAQGLAWYAWSISSYPDAETPRTSRDLADGVAAAAASCRAVWQRNDK